MPKRNPGIDISVLARATPGGILPDMRQERAYISLRTFRAPIARVLRIRGANTMRIVRPLESRGTNAPYGFNGNWKLHRATRMFISE